MWNEGISCLRRCDENTCVNTCVLKSLDKCPGVRPIGVGEVPRRIIAKAVLRVIGHDIKEAAGPLQVCARQDGGCETTVMQ